MDWERLSSASGRDELLILFIELVYEACEPPGRMADFTSLEKYVTSHVDAEIWSEFLERLRRILGAECRDVRTAVIRAINLVGDKITDFSELLRLLLEDESSSVRVAAVETLGRVFRVRVFDAVELLKPLLNDKDEKVVEAARKTLSNLLKGLGEAEDRLRVLELLKPLLRTEDIRMGNILAEAIGSIFRGSG